MTTFRAQSFTAIVGDDNKVKNLPTASPAGTPSDDLATVQGSPVGLPVSVVGKGAIIPVTLTLDTAQYADEDVLAATQEVMNAFRVAGGTAYLHSLTVLDEDDQGAALDLYFLSSNQSIGTENSALSITDQAARDLLGILSITAGDFIDMGGSRLATKVNIGLMLEAISNSTSLFIAAVSQGTGTYASGTLRLRLGILWD